MLLTFSLVAIGCPEPVEVVEAPTPDFIFVQGADPETLDPFRYASTIAANVFLHVLQPLLIQTTELELVPGLATSWEVAEDGVTWTFFLRRGVKFHDGTPFNAEAVKLNFEAVAFAVPPLPRTRMFAVFMQEVRVVDEYTVQIITKKPFAPMLANMAHPAAAIMSPTAREKLGADIAIAPVGTGPFKFVEWIPGDRVVLERNEAYWGELPKIERLIFKPVKEAASRIMMLEAGEAHLITGVTPHDVPRLKQDPEITVIAIPTTRSMYFAINHLRWPWTDLRVRQAINYAVDKETIIERVLLGFGAPLTSHLPHLMEGHVAVGPYPYNPERARELLREAGVPEGTKINLWTPHGRYVMDKEITEAVAGYLEAVGFEVVLTVWEWAAYLAATRTPAEETDRDLFYFGWAAGTVEPDWQTRPLFTTAMWPPAGWNRGFYSNPRVDELVYKAMGTINREEFNEIYAEIQRLIWEDAAWLFKNVMYHIVATRDVAGVWVFPHEGTRAVGAYFP
ncbi:MAG: Glutathione-binding protein GsiB [Syntrophomonadaceae bacterium]|nr:Glutathione-binding protein GsiB [Bacillota bacterium]